MKEMYNNVSNMLSTSCNNLLYTICIKPYVSRGLYAPVAEPGLI